MSGLIASFPFAIIGAFVAGHFFGQYVIDLVKKFVDLAWQFVKHAVVDLYQTIKNKI